MPWIADGAIRDCEVASQEDEKSDAIDCHLRRMLEYAKLYRRIAIRQCNGEEGKILAVDAAFRTCLRRSFQRMSSVCDAAVAARDGVARGGGGGGQPPRKKPRGRPRRVAKKPQTEEDKENAGVVAAKTPEAYWREFLAEMDGILPDVPLIAVGEGGCDEDRRDLRRLQALVKANEKVVTGMDSLLKASEVVKKILALRFGASLTLDDADGAVALTEVNGNVS